jgi:hypothetical protein
MHKRLTVLLFIGGCLFAGPVLAVSITFTFANDQITGGNYAFDVMAHQGGSGGTTFSDA